MSDQRAAFLTDVADGLSVSQACLAHGISRKTGHKWLKRHRAEPLAPLWDRSRKPKRSPFHTSEFVEGAVVQLRDRFGWGPQKLRDHLVTTPLAPQLPSERTFANILVRHNRVTRPAAEPQPLPLRFERSFPNQLWQFDFKAPLEVERQCVNPFVVLDDFSRYMFALRPCKDKSTRTAWDILWELFGIHGLPDSVLSDNAFSGWRVEGIRTICWIEMCLIRAGVTPIHGRPYHPQTQGKVERVNGTLEREFFPRARLDSADHFDTDCNLWRATVYNTMRPHESLGGRPPVSRWMPSSKKRPDRLPEITYPAGSLLRKVANGGDLYWNGYRILGGQGLAGQFVRVEETTENLEIFYGVKLIRKVPLQLMTRGKMV